MFGRPSLFRLLAPLCGVIVVIVLVSGAGVYLAGQRAMHRQQVQHLDRLTTLLRQGFGANQGQLIEFAKLLETRVTLIDAGGRVLLDSGADPASMENHNDRPEVVSARAGGVGTSIRFSRTLQQDAVYVAQLLDPQQRDGVVVRLSYPRGTWASFAVPAWLITLAAALSAAVCVGGFAWLLRRRWIDPLRDIGAATARMTAGQWSARVQPRGADELRELSQRLNLLAMQVQQQLADLDAQRSDLRVLVDSLPDPVLLTDAQQQIVLINALASKLVNEPELEALLESLDPQQGQIESRELRLSRNNQRLIFQAVATRTKAGGMLLVLRNISAIASAGQMKAEFVANASHELRTPIAAIKIAFETLQEVYAEDPQQTARCVSVIAGHLKRLEEMLSDLLDLSRVESAEITPNLAPVRSSELLALLRTTMGPMARQKGVELMLGAGEWDDPASEPGEFESDHRLLDLVLRNLVENSIKYTPAGGRVTVTLESIRRGTAVVLRVADTGIGIPPEHLERVFERFYQVDSARSGSSGRGTGLGLAIVKHAINALDGEVELASTPGAGTTVTCTIPTRVYSLSPPGRG